MLIATGLAAIAAIASAVAAFRQEKATTSAAIASAVAAIRQEKATFTTNLYSKQVDSLSSILTEFVHLADKMSAFDVIENDKPENPRSVDLSSTKVKELTELNSQKHHYVKQYEKLVLTGTLAIMPDEVIAGLADTFENALDAIKLLPGAVGPNSTPDGQLKYHKKIQTYTCGIYSISVCASEQFKDGITLHGSTFHACTKSYIPAHKSDCYD